MIVTLSLSKGDRNVGETEMRSCFDWLSMTGEVLVVILSVSEESVF